MRRRIAKVTIQLLYWYPFFGFLVQRLRVVPTEAVPTASIDPIGTLRINPEFVQGLSDAQLAGLLCHEMLHPAMNCWGRQGHRDQLLLVGGQVVSAWNVAHDYEINSVITRAATSEPLLKIELPPHGLYRKDWEGRSAEQIYDDVLRDCPSLPLYFGDIEGSLQGKVGEGPCVWRSHLRGALKAHKAQGKTLPDEIEKLIAEVLPPSVSWQHLVSRWTGENKGEPWYHYRRPSRRAESAGVYLPTQDRKNIPGVVVLWDTSGSMAGTESQVLGDLYEILETLRCPLRLIMCDAEVHRDFELSQDNIDEAREVKGGGGSDFCPGFGAIQTPSSDLVIAITDGYIEVPPHSPDVQAVLWLLTSEGVDPTKGVWGHVIRMTEA